MTSGLQITVRGDELSRRITERIRQHEAAANVLDTRIERRAGDQSFDVRLDDGLETLGELIDERQRCRSRISGLTLIRDNLVADEVYALTRADLRLADLMPPEASDEPEIPGCPWLVDRRNETVDGLRLTMPGEELRGALDRRIREHRRRAEWWRAQMEPPEPSTEEEQVPLPDQVCANEAGRHDWRADVLGFIRDHVDPALSYRLGEEDLAFGELLPEKPPCLSAHGSVASPSRADPPRPRSGN